MYERDEVTVHGGGSPRLLKDIVPLESSLKRPGASQNHVLLAHAQLFVIEGAGGSLHRVIVWSGECGGAGICNFRRTT